ncbi:MAG TPA: SMI1/KNR4 family protein [Chthoniobacteraceae bacterium]|jgi:hypothetical protein
MLRFHTPHSPATEEQVRLIEERIGKRLPDDYREFLLTVNGGYRPDPGIFDVPGEGTSEWHGVLGFAGRGSYDLRRHLHPESEYLPHCLPIGHDICGNNLLLGLHESHFGRIYWEDHELTQHGEQRPPIRLADSFTEFLRALRLRNESKRA